MKKFFVPRLALISGAAALVLAACSSEGPVSQITATRWVPKAIAATITTGVAVPADRIVQVCVHEASAPGSYTINFTKGQPILGGSSVGLGAETEPVITSPVILGPNNCEFALLRAGTAVSPSPITAVTLTASSNATGTWSFKCDVTTNVATTDVPLFCPVASATNENVAVAGASGYHGSSVTFRVTSSGSGGGGGGATTGCTYTQGWYKKTSRLAQVASVLSSPVVSTYITGGKLNVSGGLDRNPGTTADNTLTAGVIQNNLIPANAPASMRQLITAELNVTRGSTTTTGVVDAIAGLRAYFAGTNSTNVGAWTTTLDNFNNGLIVGASAHCGDEVL